MAHYELMSHDAAMQFYDKMMSLREQETNHSPMKMYDSF